MEECVSEKQVLGVEKGGCLIWAGTLNAPSIVVSDSVFLCFLLQYRAPYMPPTQQYPVTSGTAGFYPGTSPAEYPTYGKSCPTKPPFLPRTSQQPSTTIDEQDVSPKGEI